MGKLRKMFKNFHALKVTAIMLRREQFDCTAVKLAIHIFLAFRYVRALFHELFCEIANQSLYTSHNNADFVHL